MRLDAGLGPNSQLFGQFFRQRSPEDDPGAFPFSGMLYLNWSDLAEESDGNFSATPWQSRTFYRYRVAAEDLE